MADTPRVTVPVDEQVIKRLQEEADHPGLGDSAMVFGPDLRALLRAYESLTAAPAPEGGAVKGPGDYTMVLTEPQAFEKFPALASHIERMAVGRSVGSLIEWDAFLRELNAALATREEAPAEAGERRVSSESELKRIVKDLITHRRAGDYDLMADDVANCLWPHLRAQPPAREDAQPVANPLVFGSGAMVVNTGKFGGENAVFIAKARKPGVVGEYTWNSAFARDCLQPGELVMTFPTAEQVQAVADALCSTHPAPDALRVAVEALEVIRDSRTKVVKVTDARAVATEALAALQAEQKGGA